MTDLSPNNFVDPNVKNPFEQQTIISTLTRLPNDFTNEHRENLKQDAVDKLAKYIFNNITKNTTYLIKLGEVEAVETESTEYTAACVVQPVASGNTAAYLQAFGLLTTLHPTLEVSGEPVAMAIEIERYIREKIAALEAQIPKPEPARYKYDEAPPVLKMMEKINEDNLGKIIEEVKSEMGLEDGDV